MELNQINGIIVVQFCPIRHFIMSKNPSILRNEGTPSSGMYPIRTVAILTGVNPITLRAWERRYNLIRPQRTPKGHRMYTQEQIDLIKSIVELVESGVAISQVNHYLRENPKAEDIAGENEDPWQIYQDRMLNAIHQFDELQLDNIYNDALSLYPIDLVITRLIVPMLKLLGDRWQTEEAGVAEEHFFAVFLRNKLGARYHHLNSQSNGPIVLAACIPGEYHELGLILFCLSAVSHGIRIILLGANCPMEELQIVARRVQVQGIVLSASSRPPRRFFDGLEQLVDHVDVPVFLGGRASSVCRKQILETGTIVLGDKYQPAMLEIKSRLGLE